MKWIILTGVLLLSSGCRDAAGPSGEESPGGTAVIWFNGLSATADAYFPDTDSLITDAWLTGSAPNQIKDLGNGSFAVLSSLSAEIGVASPSDPGQYTLNVLLPPGTNPYSFAADGVTGYATLLLTDSVSLFSLITGQIIGGFPTRSNPTGVEYAENRIFVSYGNWPDETSPGGVSVYSQDSGTELAWLNTGENTQLLKLQPTGRIHCYSTTYSDDGKITVINPAGDQYYYSEIICGGAPGEAVFLDGQFISPDGWGQGGLVVYSESGASERIELPFSPTGLTLCDGFLYATSFGGNMVYVIDPYSFTVTDSLPSGGEGPQGIIAVDPAS